MNQPLIQIKNLKKTYLPDKNPYEALRGIDLDVQKGSSMAIVGKSGSGKSTLMHIMAGLDMPTTGEVNFNSHKVSDFSGKELAKLRNENFGFIFQQFFLMPNKTVLENVILPAKIGKLSRKKRIEMAKKAIEEVELTDKINNKAINLSGGQKQRVAIARAIVNEPEIVFADEPTGNLDTVTGNKIEELLFRLNKEKNITIIIVTHDHDLAQKCETQITLHDGRIL